MALDYGPPKILTSEIGTSVTASGAIERMLHERNNDVPLLTDFETEAQFLAATSGGSAVLPSWLARFNASGSGAVTRDLRTKVRERVSVLDYGSSVNDGVTDATSAIRAAITAMAGAGGGDIVFPPGAYLTTETITINDNDIHLVGEGPVRSYFTKPVSGAHKYLVVNDLQDSDGWDANQNNRLASNATVGSTTLSLQAGKGQNFTAGTYAVLISGATLEGGASVTNTRAEFVYIFSKSGDTLTLGRPIRYTYTTAQNAEVRNIRRLLSGFELRGIGFDGSDYAYGGSSVQNGNVVEIEWALKPVFRDIAAWQTPNVFLQLAQCIQASVHNLRSTDGMSNGFLDFADGFSYAVAELDLNEGLSATQLYGDGIRHLYTATNGALGYGAASCSVIGDSTSVNCRGAGFDTHPTATDISFVNCCVQGSVQHGFQLRGVRNSMSACTAMDCVGAGLNISSDASHAMVTSFRAVRTNSGTISGTDWRERGAIYDDGEYSVIDGFLTQTTGGPGVQLGGNADFGNYRNGIIRDPGQLAATSIRGFLATTSGPTIFELKDILVHDSTTTIDIPYLLNAGSITDARVIGCRGIGYSGALVSGGTFVQTIQCQGGHQAALGRRDNTLTIATGVISIENVTSSYLGIAGEGGAADNLDTINGGEEGCVIVLERNAADITLRDSSVSGGNIELVGAVAFTMDGNNDSICLRNKAGNTWREQWRADV